LQRPNALSLERGAESGIRLESIHLISSSPNPATTRHDEIPSRAASGRGMMVFSSPRPTETIRVESTHRQARRLEVLDHPWQAVTLSADQRQLSFVGFVCDRSLGSRCVYPVLKHPNYNDITSHASVLFIGFTGSFGEPRDGCSPPVA